MADPSTIPGLIARYRADSITGVADGGAVGAWPDGSGNGYTATQTGGAQPIWKANALGGKPVVRFNSAVNQTLNSPFSTVLNEVTVVSVITPADASANKAILGSSANGGLMSFIAGATPKFGPSGIGDIGVSTQNIAAGTAYVLVQTFSATTTQYRMLQNGTSAGSGTSGRTLTGAATAVIGGRTGRGDYFYNGDIAEMMVWSRALSATEVASIDSYVQDWYGIAVADYSAPGVTAAAGFTGVGTFTTGAQAAAIRGGAGSSSGQGAASASGTVNLFATANLGGTAALSSGAMPVAAGNIALSGVGALNANGTTQSYGALTFTGASALAALGSYESANSIDFAASGLLDISTLAGARQAVTFTALGSLGASGVPFMPQSGLRIGNKIVTRAYVNNREIHAVAQKGAELHL